MKELMYFFIACSLVDPHVTNYCLVISQKRNYSSLCEALEERFGVFPPEMNVPDLTKPKTKALQKVNIWDKSKGSLYYSTYY